MQLYGYRSEWKNVNQNKEYKNIFSAKLSTNKILLKPSHKYKNTKIKKYKNKKNKNLKK